MTEKLLDSNEWIFVDTVILRSPEKVAQYVFSFLHELILNLSIAATVQRSRERLV